MWYALLLLGVIAIPYLWKTSFRSAGVYFGFSSITFSIAGLVSSGFGADGRIYALIWIAYGFVSVGGVYVAFGNLRALLFLVFPIYMLFPALAFPLPWVMLFAGITLEFGVIEAYDFSRVDVGRLRAVTKGKRRFGILLAPFSSIGLLVGHFIDGKPSRSLNFLSYSLIPCCLLVAVALIWVFNAQDAAYLLLASVFVYLVAARNEFSKGLQFMSS